MARIDITGQRFGRLVVSRFVYRKGSNAYWECCCDCGKNSVVRSAHLRSGKIASCGCYRLSQVHKSNSKDISGQRFGSLIAIKWTRKVNGHQGRVWLCQCDCGETREVPISKLTGKRVYQCLSCSGSANGIKTSEQQRWLAKITNGILNYKIGRFYADVALLEQRTVIEYDGWYWHKDKKEQDRLRTQEIIKEGWSVVHIKSRRELPSLELICSAIELAKRQHCVNIVMADWNNK